MRIAATVVLLLAAAAAGAASAPALLTSKLDTLAGAGARDCGSVPLSANRAAAIQCARAAAAANRAYRVAFELSGVDTYTWQGAARNAEGRQWVVYYDADTSAGPQASPGLGQLLCRELGFSADKPEAVDCTPATGSL